MSGRCCGSPGSSRSSWWCRSPPTSRSSAPPRWPCPRWRTRVSAAAIAAAPFLGGLPGLAAALAVFGLGLGFDNVISVTLIQRWAPPAMLGRVWGLLLLAGAGSFPVATFVAGQLTRHLGPTVVFPVTGGLLALAMIFGLSQREFRDFGAGRSRVRVEP